MALTPNDPDSCSVPPGANDPLLRSSPRPADLPPPPGRRRPSVPAATTKVCSVERWHESPWACPLHGCPDCFVENLLYDADALEPPTGRQRADWDLWEFVVVEQGTCLVCEEIRHQDYLRRNPGARCEARGCLHCQSCGVCMLEAEVCRNCGDCLDCADIEGACGQGSRWSPRLGRSVPYAVHETYDRLTGRWG